MVGELRETSVLRTFRSATTLALAARIADRMLKGERLFEEHIVSRYNQGTGTPEAWTWVPSDEKWGKQLMFWPTYEFNSPSLRGFPSARILLTATKSGPVLVGDILFRYCPEQGMEHGTIPESIIVERVRIVGGRDGH